MQIVEAVSAEDVARVSRLMLAYVAHLRAGPMGVSGFHLQPMNAEAETLPGIFAAPDGVLLLAKVDGNEAAGCVAVRPARESMPASPGEKAAEMKRLWVDPGAQGMGIGRALIEAATAWAEGAGYDAVYFDTSPQAMPEAIHLYRKLGFEVLNEVGGGDPDELVYLRRRFVVR